MGLFAADLKFPKCALRPVCYLGRSETNFTVGDTKAHRRKAATTAPPTSAIVQMLWGERRGHGTMDAVQRLPMELPDEATKASLCLPMVRLYALRPRSAHPSKPSSNFAYAGRTA